MSAEELVVSVSLKELVYKRVPFQIKDGIISFNDSTSVTVSDILDIPVLGIRAELLNILISSEVAMNIRFQSGITLQLFKPQKLEALLKCKVVSMFNGLLLVNYDGNVVTYKSIDETMWMPISLV